MLSILLLILKTIGIIILVLLGILLLVILMVLFVPIRYRVTAEHGDSFDLDGGVSWFLHLVHAKYHKSDKSQRIWIRIFGILVYDSSRPHKPKSNKTYNKHSKKNKESNHTVYKKEESAYDEKKEESSDIQKEKSADDEIGYDEKIHDENMQNSINHGKSMSDGSSYDISEEKSKKDTVKDSAKESNCIVVKTYKRIKEKVINFFQNIKNKIRVGIQKLLNIKNKARLILDFIRDDINKEGFHSTYESLKKLLKHILPKKVRSRLIFGTGDPSSTGLALGLFGILYSIYGDKLQLTPDFEKKIFEGSHYVKGRIRIWSILIIVIKLLLDKRFNKLKTNFQLLKEAL